MTNIKNLPAENGVLPNEFGTYPCSPDHTACWRQGRNFVEAKLLALQGGAYAYGIDFGLKNEGQVGPLSADRSAANREDAIAALQKVIKDSICGIANRHGLEREARAISKFAESLADSDAWQTPGKLDLPRTPAVDDAAIGELIVAVSEQDARARAIAAQVGYQLPADSTAPDLICRDIAANMRRSVEACLEIGRALITLKAACPHGEYLQRIDALGIEESVARRFTQTAIKFSNRATSHDLLKAIGSQSKLFEFLMLDDEQIEELELTGQTGELKLDDVASMSVKELRKSLRDLRERAAAKDKVAENNQKTIQELQEQLAVNQSQPTPEITDAETRFITASKELDAAVTAALASMMGVHAQVAALRETLAADDVLLQQTINAACRRVIGAGRRLAEFCAVPLAFDGTGDNNVDPENEDAEFWASIQKGIDPNTGEPLRAGGSDNAIDAE